MSANNEPPPSSISIKSLVGQIFAMLLVFVLVLFLPAGTIHWLAGWIFLLLFFAFVVAISVWLYRNNPGLLAERMSGLEHTQQTWDKILLGFVAAIFFAWLAFMALDARRFHWSHMPVWLQAVGSVLLIASFYLFFLTFR
jgi:protein-S-isoprenylcysteine O-methyltransferase Ste14